MIGHTLGVRGCSHRCASGGAVANQLSSRKHRSVSQVPGRGVAHTLSRATSQGWLRTPGRCRERVPERAFWSAVTSNPPLYGADTPTSFFDRRLPFGWNLRDLQVLKRLIRWC